VSKKKIYRSQRVEYYARYWLDLTQQKKLDREIEQATQVNKKVLSYSKMYYYTSKWLKYIFITL